MSQSSIAVEGNKLRWHVQMWLICPDGTNLIASDSGLWVRTPAKKVSNPVRAEPQRGTAATLEAAMEEVARGQDLGGREWLRIMAADAGDEVLVYVYPVEDHWRFLIQIGKARRIVEKRPTEQQAKRDVETILNKARMRAAMPATAQKWGQA